LFGWEITAGQQFRGGFDGVQRGADFVADIGQELVFGAFQLAKAGAEFAETRFLPVDDQGSEGAADEAFDERSGPWRWRRRRPSVGLPRQRGIWSSLGSNRPFWREL